MKMTSMSEAVLKDIVGHSTAMDTFGTYGHILKGEAREAAEIIDLTLGAGLGADLGATLSAEDGQTGE